MIHTKSDKHIKLLQAQGTPTSVRFVPSTEVQYPAA